jgi:hypothetical protein
MSEKDIFSYTTNEVIQEILDPHKHYSVQLLQANKRVSNRDTKLL